MRLRGALPTPAFTKGGSRRVENVIDDEMRYRRGRGRVLHLLMRVAQRCPECAPHSFAPSVLVPARGCTKARADRRARTRQ